MKKIWRTILGFCFLLSFTASARAQLPAVSFDLGTGTDSYRIGDEWGKKPVSLSDLNRATPSFRRAALATAGLNGATSFYLGKFHGHHVMATNHHVFPSDFCASTGVHFPLLNVYTNCELYLGSWEEIDLTLFTVNLTPEQEAKLLPVAGPFRFQDDVVPAEKLLTIGFGIAGNPRGQLMANQDSDCYVFSGRGDYRLMADPDEINPGDYRAWSFALGCDVSHGDSGSAIVDRDSGNVVGIIWTGRIPKSAAVQSSAQLTRMFQSQSEAIWQELSYAVPAKKMGEVLGAAVREGGLEPEANAILSEMLKY